MVSKRKQQFLPKKAAKPLAKPPSSLSARFRRVIMHQHFEKSYAILCMFVLAVSTVFWSYLSAKLQQSNADQLSDPLMFSNTDVFHGSAFPAQHTFLLKWPLFVLVKLYGFNTKYIIWTTVAITLVTIAIFAVILYRIEKRPIVFGTICLALASCLLLVPAQPHPGGLLPVNMAMITTRNLEYIIYILGLLWVAKQPRFNSWRFWAGTLLLTLVSISDRLFLDIGVGAAIFFAVVFGLRKRWNYVSLSLNWLVIGVTAAIIALAGLWVLDAAQVVHIVGQSDTSPYSSVTGIKALILGAGYMIFGLFTNFGANPADGAQTVRGIPHALKDSMLSVTALSYLVNVAVLVLIAVAIYKIVRFSLFSKKVKNLRVGPQLRISLLMICSAITASLLFIVVKHEYVADARYLTIWLFAGFIVLAAYSSSRKLHVGRVIVAGMVCIVAILAAIPNVLQHYDSGRQVLEPFETRNVLIARALKTHDTPLLVGDYWRVIPIAALASQNGDKSLSPYPLSDCTQPRNVLTSAAWKPDLKTHKFAYLVSFDRGLTDFPGCSLNTVTTHYGRPNASELIAGTLAKPSELLLFYDSGTNTSANNAPVTTILPIGISEVPNLTCPVPTSVNVIAHEDDDILFMNPDIQRDIQAGHCVRTIFLTAGDDGMDRGYWLSREQGTQAAYSSMIGGAPQTWLQRVIKLHDNQYVTIANPKGNHNVSLVYFRLPDGNLRGDGFGATKRESLAGLNSGLTSLMHSVDDQSQYTSPQLVSAITTLYSAFRPTVIRTQSDYQSHQYNDHSDHGNTGKLAGMAYAKYEQEQYEGQVTVPIKYYLGYPVRELPVNLTRDEIGQKQEIFLKYSLFDGSVCHSAEECSQTGTYGSYLQREYQQ